MERNKFFASIDFEDESLIRSIYESISDAQLSMKDEDGRSLLHNAVSKNRQFLVEVLINKGSSVNTSDENGWTPLHTSCSSGYIEISKLLIDNNAACNAVTNSGCTPLHYAASKGHSEIVKLLINKDKSIIDIKDSYGRTAIFMSACSGKQECFDILFKANADITFKENISGDTILHVAINGDHQEIALKIASKNPEMLLEKNNEGKIPLDYSNKEFTDELFEIIKEKFDKTRIEKLLC